MLYLLYLWKYTVSLTRVQLPPQKSGMKKFLCFGWILEIKPPCTQMYAIAAKKGTKKASNWRARSTGTILMMHVQAENLSKNYYFELETSGKCIHSSSACPSQQVY